MAKKERMTEELKYLTEMLKLLWLTIVALVGSIAGLALAELGLRRWAIGGGTLVALGLLTIVGRILRRIRVLIKQFEEV